MKTIAVTMDEDTIKLLDELAGRRSRARSRSSLVRLAVRELAERERRRQTEAEDDRILQKHRTRLARETRALVAGQARP